MRSHLVHAQQSLVLAGNQHVWYQLHRLHHDNEIQLVKQTNQMTVVMLSM